MNYLPIYTNVIQINMDMFCDVIKKFQSESLKYSIFEIGSRDGIDAKIMMSHFIDSDVYAFEASSQEYNNHKEQNKDINWINLAIYNYDGEIDFNLKGYLSGVHSIRDRENISGTIDKVKCKRIDTFCNENKIDSIDFVKIDVEGYEWEVLQGAKQTISMFKPKIIIEYSPDLYSKINPERSLEIYLYLKNLGYIIVNVDNDGSIYEIVNSFDQIKNVHQTNLYFQWIVLSKEDGIGNLSQSIMTMQTL